MGRKVYKDRGSRVKWVMDHVGQFVVGHESWVTWGMGQWVNGSMGHNGSWVNGSKVQWVMDRFELPSLLYIYSRALYFNQSQLN